MSDRSIVNSPASRSPTDTPSPAAARPGSIVRTVTAKAVRLLSGAGCALAAIYWLDLGGGRASRLRRWWLDRDKNRNALAALDDDQLCDLSEIGRQIRRDVWREAWRAKRRM